MNNRVTEEIIKITFGDNWLIAAFVFVVAVSAIRFIRKNNLPKYFRKCLPMPERYRCFKEIDYMFKDLRGRIIEKNQKIKPFVSSCID